MKKGDWLLLNAAKRARRMRRERLLLQVNDSAVLLPRNYARQTKKLQMLSNTLRHERGFQMKPVKQGVWQMLSSTHNFVHWKP
jgi:hypothetical protein